MSTKHSRAPVLMLSAALGCGLVTAGAIASAQGTAPHGAQPMDKQIRSVDVLVPPDSVKTPLGVSQEVWDSLVPKQSKGTKAEVALGKKLYFETRLSGDGTVACATCHDVSRGFADQRNTSEGIGGKLGRRNAPTTLNAALLQTQFWDGRAKTLEDQARLPITNPIEMGMKDEKTAVESIAGDAEYVREFRDVYGREPNMDDIARAIAAFERTLVFLDSPFDRFLRGEDGAISADARAGWALFNGKGRCNSCHQMNTSNPLGTDSLFHNIGVSARHQDFEKLAKKALSALEKDDSEQAIDALALETELSELGRFVVTRNYGDIGSFKTQQIRNVALTAPYMHDGSLQTLWDVIDHYNKGGERSPYLDGGIEPLDLTESEIDQLVAFMFALTDVRFAKEGNAEFARQKSLAAKQRPIREKDRANRKILPFESSTGDKK